MLPPSIQLHHHHSVLIQGLGAQLQCLRRLRHCCRILPRGRRSTTVKRGHGPGGRYSINDFIDALQTHCRQHRTSDDNLASIAARSYKNYPTRWKKTYLAVVETKNCHTIACRTGAVLSRMVPPTMMLWRRRRHSEHRAPVRSEMWSHEPLFSLTGRTCQRYQILRT